MNIIEKRLDEIRPYENNPRHNDAAVEYVANSLREFGWKQPIVIDKDGVIVAGHTRYKAAQRLGLKTAPCLIADDLTPDQVKAYRLADNKTGEAAEWDFAELERELDDIEMDMSAFGFLDEELNDVEAVEDDGPSEPPAEPKAKRGDIYKLGRHRLMCGDSTGAEDVAELMDGRLADIFLTDPPYNVDYTDGHENERKILNDAFATDEECGKKLWLPAFTNAIHHANGNCSVYCFMPQGGTHMMMMMMMRAGWQVKHELIWRKQSIVLNRADYNYQHEPILFGWNKTHTFYGGGAFHNTSVWDFDRPTKSKEHPTMKPVELLGEILKNSTQKDDTVLDLFGGSGSTLIACEQLGRDCFMMELDPKYIDVIIERWESFTGKKAVLISERKG